MSSKTKTIKRLEATIEQFEDQITFLRAEDHRRDAADRERGRNATQRAIELSNLKTEKRALEDALFKIGFIAISALTNPVAQQDSEGRTVQVTIADARIVKGFEDKLAADRKPSYRVGGYTGVDTPVGVRPGVFAGHSFVPGVHPGILGDWIVGR